jgi:methionyl-tRNA formyltransferase
MKTVSKTILFFGNERLATGVTTTAPILQALIDNGYNVAAVIVAQGSAASSRKNRELEIETVAESHNIPLLAFDNLAGSLEQLANYGAAAAVLVAYGKLIPSAVIDLFPSGIVNLHPSLLPKHRGPTPLESTILGGDTQTGVSLMKLATKMDAGPVYDQRIVQLNGDETKQSLADNLSSLGKEMLLTHLPGILADTTEARPQGDSNATYDQLISKDSGILDEQAWNQPVELLSRQVRAYAGWPRSRTKIKDLDIIITKSHHLNVAGKSGSLWFGNKEFGIHGSDGVLVIDSLIPASKKEMSGYQFMVGYLK